MKPDRSAVMRIWSYRTDFPLELMIGHSRIPRLHDNLGMDPRVIPRRVNFLLAVGRKGRHNHRP